MLLITLAYPSSYLYIYQKNSEIIGIWFGVSFLRLFLPVRGSEQLMCLGENEHTVNATADMHFMPSQL